MFKIKKHSLTYTQIIASGFAILIALGTVLLSLPFSIKEGGRVSFVDALFTAASASCVTGLVVFDTFTKWSLFGKLVILGLIQIGGLGFMTIITLFSFLFKRKIGLHERSILQESYNAQYIGGIIRLTRKILLGTLIFEGTGAIILSLCFIPKMGAGPGIFAGIFTSISAFCNAGFDLMGIFGEYSSLIPYFDNWPVMMTVSLLAIIGGIGFFVWDDLCKEKFHFRRYKLHTKIVLTATAILLVFGTVVFFIFEYDATMKGMSFSQRLNASIFCAVTPRTAGFNSVDTAMLSPAGKLLTILYMFIGGSPGSTAGGVKTTTIVAILCSVWANMRHKSGCNVFNRRLDDDVLDRASSVIVINLVLTLAVSLLVAALQSELDLSDVIFECFSASGTVGMTCGITRDLNVFSRLLVAGLMFCGRVGSLSFALVFAERRVSDPAQLPKEKISIG